MAVPVIATTARASSQAATPGSRAAVSRTEAPSSASTLTAEREERRLARQEERHLRRSQEQAQKAKNPREMRFTGVKPSASLYLGVSMIAVLKDLLDLVGIGSLPAIGTVVTICFTFLIWMLLALFDHSSDQARYNMHLARGLVVLGFGLVEAVGFGLNFLPLQTAMVIVLYILAKRAWRQGGNNAAV